MKNSFNKRPSIFLTFIGLVLILMLSGCNRFGFLFSPTFEVENSLSASSSPSWKWKELPGAESYEVAFSEEGPWRAVQGNEFALPEDEYLADGDYTLYVKAKSSNKDGEFYSNVSSFTITIDTQSPTLPQFTFPVEEGDLIINTAYPRWEWTWTDSAERDNLFYALSDQGPWIELSKSSRFFQPDTAFEQGDYTLFLKTTDKAGNISDGIQNGATITVDFTIFPAPNVYAKTNGLTIDELSCQVNVSKPLWGWTMELPDSEVEYLRAYRYQLDSQRESTWIYQNDSSVGPTGSFEPDVDLSEGNHTLYVQAGRIISEGVYNWSASGSFSFVLDLTKPNAPVVAGNKKVISGTNPTWTWELSTESVTVQYRLVPGVVTEADFSSADELPASVKEYSPVIDGENEALGIGFWSLIVRVKDAVGNWSDSSAFTSEVSTVVASTPQVTLSSPINPTNDTTPTWDWTCTGNVGAYRIRMDGGAWVIQNAAQNSYTPQTVLPDGERQIEVQMLPSEYNEETAADSDWSDSGVSSVVVDTIPPPAPVVSGEDVTGSKKPLWTWTNTDPTVNLYRYCLRHATKISEGVYDYSSSLLWTDVDSSVEQYQPDTNLNVEELEADFNKNYYALFVQSSDALGNWSSTGSFISYINLNVPDPPEVYGNALISSKSLTWTWGNLVDGADLIEYRFEDDPWVEMAVDGLNSVSYTYSHASELSDGVWSFSVRNRKSGVWSGASTFLTTIDITGPTVPSVNGLVEVGTKRPTWNWSVPATTAGFQIKLERNLGATIETGSWELHTDWFAIDDNTIQSYTATVDLLDPEVDAGFIRFSIVAKDSLGNWSVTAGEKITKINAASGAAPDVTSSSDLTNNKRPTWTWSLPDGATSRGFQYKLNEGVWQPETTKTTFKPGYDLGSGSYTLYVKAISETGIESAEGSFLVVVDVTGPAQPNVTSKNPVTGDLTPLWSWDEVSGAVAYRYNLNNSDWSAEVTTLSFVPESDLEYGTYTLYVQALDELRNPSTSGFSQVIVDPTSTLTGKPSKVPLVSVSKGELSQGVRIEWVTLIDAESYNINRITRAQYEAGETIGSPLTVESAQQGTASNGNQYYYDLSANDGESYYYRVCGVNTDGIGLSSNFSISSEKEFARGRSLIKATGITSDSSTGAELISNWNLVEGATDYYLFRAGPYSQAQSVGGLTWQYIPDGDTVWVDGDETKAIDTMKGISTVQYVDNDNISMFRFYYYKVFAVNTVSKDNPQFGEEAVVPASYWKSDTSSVFELNLFPDPSEVNSWFTASDNDNSCPGKIRLSINVPAKYEAAIPHLDFTLQRSYRWGGGYQGHPAIPFGTGINVRTHSLLNDPDPATATMLKTIELEYDVSPASFAGSSRVVYDTLYDVDSNGDKLIAVTNNDREIYGTDVKAWYERTQSVMDADALNWTVVNDPDGSPAEHEWHYLKWDWVIRKQALGNKANYKNFDINLMTRAEYSLSIVYDDGVVTETYQVQKNAWPALTKREFAFLAMVIREIAFYRLRLSYYDEHEELGMNALDFAEDSGTGWIKGSIRMYDSGKEGGVIVPDYLYGKIQTAGGDHGGISDFTGVEVQVDWSSGDLFRIKTGESAYRSINGRDIYLYTPKWSGKITIWADLIGGTWIHGVYGGVIGITYGGYAEDGTPENRVDANIANEYLNQGCNLGWRTTTDWVKATGYGDRYTSINWSHGSDAYPAGHSNFWN